MNLSRVFLYSSALTFIANYAVAKYCVKLPTCEELGYIYSADKYPNNRSIKCPFDTKKILLLDYCQAYGLTSCDSTSGECDECIVEKADGTKSNSGYWRYTRCNAGYSYKSGECPPTEVNREQYPHEGSEGMDESIGEVECVQSAQNVYCGYKSCNEGWDINSGNCIVHDCGSAYPYTSCDTNGTCGECKSGEHTKYSAPTCNNGWYTSGSACVENDCSAFTSATSSITGCSSSSSCLSGTKTTYKCDTCYTGYEVLNGACNKICTYTATNLPTNCATATGSCQLGSASGTTTYYATTCSTCNNGYEVSSGSCVAAACTGYTSTSSSITGCQTVSSACLSGTTNKYKCNTCYTGYSLSSGKCNKTCTYTSCDENGICEECKSGFNMKYSAATCNSGYYKIDNKCQAPCIAAGTCQVGDIYAYNGTPIGVVFFDDGNTTKIIALRDINSEGKEENGSKLYWATSTSGNYRYNITTLSDVSISRSDMDGKGNTEKAYAYISANNVPSQTITAIMLYAPQICNSTSFCGVGKWYLPAAGEFGIIADNYTTMQNAVLAAGGGIFHQYNFYWTSSKYYFSSGNVFWTCLVPQNTIGYWHSYNQTSVRPALQISK